MSAQEPTKPVPGLLLGIAARYGEIEQVDELLADALMAPPRAKDGALEALRGFLDDTRPLGRCSLDRRPAGEGR